jgi:hypothetical protein
MANYFLQVAIGVDQLVNTLLGGWADETLSSRCYRQQHKLRWRVAQAVVNFIFFWQYEHCRQAYLSEINRAQTFEYRRVPD